MRHERDREAEQLRDLGRVLVRADRVRGDVVEHGGRVRAAPSASARRRRCRTCRRPRRSPGRRSRDRRQREQGGGRVAARVRDQRGRWAARAPGARSTSSGVEPVRAGEVDDDRAGGRLELALSSSRQQKTSSAPAASASSFGTKREGRRGRSARAAGRARRRLPASESEPSATSSSSGWASTRSSVSCPENPRDAEDCRRDH